MDTMTCQFYEQRLPQYQALARYAGFDVVAAGERDPGTWQVVPPSQEPGDHPWQKLPGHATNALAWRAAAIEAFFIVNHDADDLPDWLREVPCAELRIIDDASVD